MQIPSSTRFFRFVWRANGLAFFVLLTLGILSMGFAWISSMGSSTSKTQAQQPHLAPRESGKKPLQLGLFEAVPQSKCVRAELFDDSNRGYSIKNSYNHETHNLLFADLQTGNTWWLLPHSDSIIRESLPIKASEKDSNPPMAWLHLIESNRAQTRTFELLLANPKGQQQLSLAKGQLTLEACIPISSQETRVIYRNERSYFALTLNPSTLTKVSETPLNIQFPKASK